MSGAVAGPALRFFPGQGGTVRLSRLWGAIGLALAMHVAVLAIRPGGRTTNYIAPATKTMAVRMLRPLAPQAEATGPSVGITSSALPKVAPAEKTAIASAAPGERKPRSSAWTKAPGDAQATIGSAARDVRQPELASKPGD